jgi:hypothetical protein
MKSLAGPIILLLIAAGVYMANVSKPYAKKTPSKKDWVKIRACIAESAKILNDEAMRTYRLIDWDNTTPEQMDERGKLLSRLNVEKIDRDSECREKYSF